jgi:hypothetical protein
MLPIPSIESTFCPRTVAEARAMTVDGDTYVGVATVIRFIPSENDETYRGYDIRIEETFSEGRQFIGETVLLRVPSRVPGIRATGELALVVAMRTNRATLFTPGVCTALVEVSESQLDDERDD